jgi:energy-coupling factor transporter ATP-binding protein EcfA2
MKYAEFINGNDNFQYSINLNYDLMNDDKIDCYIPTKKSIEILNDYLLNTVSDNKDNATVLVGPYGKGKSHLLLILIAILYGRDKNKTLNKLVDKIKVIDKKAGELTKEVLKNKKYLPLIINFNSRDLNQAFLIALKNALLLAGLEGILPNTYFNSAIDTINNWEDHPNKQMINMVEKLVQDKCGLTLKKFVDTLKSYNEDNYKIFTDIFKEITLGIEFNPMTNSDIVKLIEETNLKLCEKYNYDGIIIVFDEFSKFIESSETINNSKDLKVIQDIAELSSRSKVPKLQIVCITHKPIDEYIAQIPKNKIDGWRTIEGNLQKNYL